MLSVECKLSPEFTYTGAELRRHFLLSQFGMKGTALMAFQGPCEVPTEHMVDLEDSLVGDFIRAKSMIHFLGEFFGISLKEGVLFQRLMMSIMKEVLESLDGNLKVERKGDDLFVDRKKLSVSIVTVSPVSVLFHAGINFDETGAPVSATGLKNLKADPACFAQRVLERARSEWDSIEWACAKVRPVL